MYPEMMLPDVAEEGDGGTGCWWNQEGGCFEERVLVYYDLTVILRVILIGRVLRYFHKI